LGDAGLPAHRLRKAYPWILWLSARGKPPKRNAPAETRACGFQYRGRTAASCLQGGYLYNSGQVRSEDESKVNS
jgi:hypothetical protein